MNRFAYLFPLLAACTGGERADSGQCPAGETCSPATPRGLHFIGESSVDQIFISGPGATAIGGTQEVALQYDRGDGTLIALDQPFRADDDGGLGVRIDATAGSVVTLRGVASRQNYLRIVDPTTNELYDRRMVTGAAIASIGLLATTFENVPAGVDIAFATGKEKIGVALYGDVQDGSFTRTERLVDHSMVLSGAGGAQTAWDTLEIANAAVGTRPLAVTAGDRPTATIDLVFVDHADAVKPFPTNPTVVTPAAPQQLCFSALAGTRYIANLVWFFTVDGIETATTQGQLERNCVTVSTLNTSGTVAVTARAGGQTAQVTLTAASAAAASHFVPSGSFGFGGHGTTAGDRAAM